MDISYDSLPGSVREFFDDQYLRAYMLISDLRYEPTGLYRDAYLTTGEHRDICSIAAVGVGLIALAIGDMAGFESNAVEKAIITLNSVLGRTAGCEPCRDLDTGFFCHWIDVASGEPRWNSEISTIDTALLVSGALFAMNYFQHQKLTRLVRELYHSIMWRSAIADPKTGALFLVIENGEGKQPLLPFNEYAIVANLARYEDSPDSRARKMWNEVFRDSALVQLPRRSTPAGDILCMREEIPSSFVYQFPFYLVNEYTTGTVYRHFYRRIALADKGSWNQKPGIPGYVWGHGAGTNSRGYYHADAIGNNPTHTASPHIIAGFLPVYPEGIYDLYHIYRYLIPYDTYRNPADPADERRFKKAYRYGLGRIELLSKPGRRWYQDHMSAIDWSTMLYGLTAFKYGIQFFARYNDFSTVTSRSASRAVS